MPSVARLSTTPVKGTALHSPPTVTITGNGVADNRRFHLVDARRRLFNGKQHGPLVRLTADYDTAEEHLRLQFPDRPPVEGRATERGEAVRTDFYGRGVDGHLVVGPWSAALSDFVGEQVHLVAVDRPGDAVDVHPVTLVSSATLEHLRLQFPDRSSVEGRAAELGEAVRTDFYGRDVDGHVVVGPWSAALSDFVGEEVHLVSVDRPGDAVDVHPVTLISTATLEHL
ncbi:MAG: hypothetical protein JWR66_1319, partial [Modestobacter sp.]|nr:hypothetical protein [Modestobacter sp.]